MRIWIMAALFLPTVALARGGYSREIKPSLPADIAGEIEKATNHTVPLILQTRTLTINLPADAERAAPMLGGLLQEFEPLTYSIELLDNALLQNHYLMTNKEALSATTLLKQSIALETASRALRVATVNSWPGSGLKFWNAEWKARHRAASIDRLAMRLHRAAESMSELGVRPEH